MRSHEQAAVFAATTRAAVRRCYPVVAELRSHLSLADFEARLARQGREGYKVAAVEAGGRVVAFAGYRVMNMLYQRPTGKMLYVDDLVTAADGRSKGYGRLLFDWLVQEARRLKCDALELDSGVQRVGAHRFYLGVGMHISSYHFRIPLGTEPPRVLFADSKPGAKRRRR